MAPSFFGVGPKKPSIAPLTGCGALNSFSGRGGSKRNSAGAGLNDVEKWESGLLRRPANQREVQEVIRIVAFDRELVVVVTQKRRLNDGNELLEMFSVGCHFVPFVA